MEKLSDEQKAEIKEFGLRAEGLCSEYAARSTDAVRLFESSFVDPVRTPYAVDVDRIINCKFFNRGADKTQVFSFRKNDDITRRSSHVHFVSRIARKIGKALRLNADLIEAIAIGHDVGHTPFGHAGERILGGLYLSHTGKYFNHNVHSVRVLDYISRNNLTVQTLDGILCHCGEKVDGHYEPAAHLSAESFLARFSECYTKKDAVSKLRPSTLEGCVVRLCDMAAYIGKDRQDAAIALSAPPVFDCVALGTTNAQIIDAVSQDVIARSMNKPYLSLSDDVISALREYVRENNEKIYKLPEVCVPYDEVIAPMAKKLYEKLLSDLESGDFTSPIFTHFLDDPYIHDHYFVGEGAARIFDTFDDIVVDYMASMTDDYFLDAFARLFPTDPLNDKPLIVGYFDGRALGGKE